MGYYGPLFASLCLSLPLWGTDEKKTESVPSQNVSAQQKNIIFILADDLGYGDVGWLYQNQREQGQPQLKTPNIDRLAQEGMTLSAHYCPAPVCAPSRASLMTGVTQGHCSLRNNQFDHPIQEKITLASVLQDRGYRTYAVGKWGIGGGGQSGVKRVAHPLDRGFDHYYGFLDHLAGHTYYHYEGFLQNAYMGIFEDREKVTESAIGIYSTDLFTARAKKYIVNHYETTPEQPFFLFYAINTIHGSGRLDKTVPCKKTLHVPGRPYPAGGGLQGGVQWPLQPEKIENRNTWIHPDYAHLPEMQARYATSIRRMDDAIGDLSQLLKDLKIDDKTILIFTSDNGPADEYGADPRFFGSAGPFDGLKRDCYEGGIREPTFIRAPGFIKANSICHEPCGFWDWLPTFAEIGGGLIPASTDGVSLLPLFLGQSLKVPSCIYTEYNGGRSNQADFKEFAIRKQDIVRGEQRFLRIGDYAVLNAAMKSPDAPLRLYNVVKDPFEKEDLASNVEEFDRIQEMKRILTRVRRVDLKEKRIYDAIPVAALTEQEIKNLPKSKLGIMESQMNYVPNVFLSDHKSTSFSNCLNDSKLVFQSSSIGLLSTIQVPETGDYTFFRTNENGVVVRLHQLQLFRPGESQTVIRLEKGIHPILLNATSGSFSSKELKFEITIQSPK